MYMCTWARYTGLRNLHRKRCETCERHKRREETGQKMKFSALYIPTPGFNRKQDLKVLCQVCVFRADRKNKVAALTSYWLRHFRLLLWNQWTESNDTWQEARFQHHLPNLCFSGLWLADIFDFSSETAEQNSTFNRKQDLNVLCFSGRSEKQDGRPDL